MSKPKLTIEKVINKSFIVWGKTYNTDMKVFLKPDIGKEQYTELQQLNEFVIIDYENKKREWYVTYFNYGDVLSCTIDDISGSYSITSF